MIDRIRVRRWRCLQDVTLELTPLHALIGPNDSGKSTLLRAVEHAGRVVRLDDDHAILERSGPNLRLTLGPDNGVHGKFGMTPLKPGPTLEEVRTKTGTPSLFRLDPDQMRLKSTLIPDAVVRLEPRGGRLPGVYDAILNRDRDAFASIEKDLVNAFPSIRRLSLRPVDDRHKVMEVQLTDGTRVTAEDLSEGMLYWLAFAALPHLGHTGPVLVEEPENGLHPARIRDVMRVLRAMSERGTQVLLATHSPLVVNELRPEEVSVVTRTPEAGTKVRRVSAIPDLDRLLSAFSLGELWLAFADGIQEEALFEARRDAS
ncbi:MAG: AAA family ATPase [Alphaproteobacteria bacterium]|nr:AAA family ATPase [Alphaproteobacteria bacterium]MCB9699671.1 AAA family ATPase [Alphaproteobacteria bacterium]